LVSVEFGRGAFAIGTLFFVGQALGLAGHYQLFNRSRTRKFVWFPRQEKVVFTLTIASTFAYIYLVLTQ
jgi:hypothetical protein